MWTEFHDQVRSSGNPKYLNTSIESSSDILIAHGSVGREISQKDWSTMTTMVVFYSHGVRLVVNARVRCDHGCWRSEGSGSNLTVGRALGTGGIWGKWICEMFNIPFHQYFDCSGWQGDPIATDAWAQINFTCRWSGACHYYGGIRMHSLTCFCRRHHLLVPGRQKGH